MLHAWQSNLMAQNVGYKSLKFSLCGLETSSRFRHKPSMHSPRIIEERNHNEKGIMYLERTMTPVLQQKVLLLASDGESPPSP